MVDWKMKCVEGSRGVEKARGEGRSLCPAVPHASSQGPWVGITGMLLNLPHAVTYHTEKMYQILGIMPI